MAASATFTAVGTAMSKDVVKYTWSWTSAADGTVSSASPYKISGEILRVVFNPGATAPTTLYDITLTDENSMDVLAGQGGNLSEVNTTNVCPGVPLKDGTTTSTRPIAVHDTLTLNVTNAGDSKQGTVDVYVR
jgi:hypothetical protein